MSLVMLTASERPWIYNRQTINLYLKNHMNWLVFFMCYLFGEGAECLLLYFSIKLFILILFLVQPT
jgi:hypothetical protein